MLALAVLLLFNWFFTPGFFRIEVRDGRLFGSLIDVVNRAAPVILLSLGMTLVIATAGIDLSVGAVMAIAGSAAALLISKGHGAAMGVLGGFGAGLLAGSLNGVLVSSFKIQPIIATLILMVAGRGVAQLLTGGQMVQFDNDAFEFLGSGFFLGLPFTIWIVALASGVIYFLTRRTGLGLFLESVGGNSLASHFSGVAVGPVKFFAYAASGICAAMGGMIVTADIRAADANTTGMYLELDAILAVVIGGTALTGGRFSLAGSVAGALLMQALTTTILSRGIPVEFTLVVKAAVILIVSLLQSELARTHMLALARRRT